MKLAYTLALACAVAVPVQALEISAGAGQSSDKAILAKIENKLQGLMAVVEALANDTSTRLDAIESQLSDIGTQISDLETATTGLQTSTNDLESRVTALESGGGGSSYEIRTSSSCMTRNWYDGSLNCPDGYAMTRATRHTGDSYEWRDFRCCRMVVVAN